MIELVSVTSGTVSTKTIIKRKTKLRQIDKEINLYLSVYSRLVEKECVSFESEEFETLITANYNRDVSYFKEFSKYISQDGLITTEINTSIVEDEKLTKYKITFDRDFMIALNPSQHESTIRKVVRTITGV